MKHVIASSDCDQRLILGETVNPRFRPPPCSQRVIVLGVGFFSGLGYDLWRGIVFSSAFP
jgi:hypothetical protein